MSILRLFGMGKKSPAPAIHQITVHEAHDRASTGALTLIDVRQYEEWNETGRPEGSYGITLQDEAFNDKVLKVLDGDYGRPVAFSCKSGGRSSQATEKAKAAGFLDISNVQGGFLAWQDADLPIDRGPF